MWATRIFVLITRMATKLTLTIDKAVIERAKRYAEKTGRSLSHLVESYLNTITKSEPDPKENLPEDLRKLFGSISLPLDLNHKKEIRKILGNRKK